MASIAPSLAPSSSLQSSSDLHGDCFKDVSMSHLMDNQQLLDPACSPSIGPASPFASQSPAPPLSCSEIFDVELLSCGNSTLNLSLDERRSPMDAVVPGMPAVGDPIFDLGDAAAFPMQSLGTGHQPSPESATVPHSPEVEEGLRRQLSELRCRIREKKQELEEVQLASAFKVPANLQGAKLSPGKGKQDSKPAASARAKARASASSPLGIARETQAIKALLSSSSCAPMLHTTTRWTPSEQATLVSALAKYPVRVFGPLRRCILAAQHVPTKSTRDVAHRIVWMASSVANAAPPAKRAKLGAGDARRVSIDLTKGAAAHEKESAVRNLLAHNDKLLQSIQCNLSKLAYADNRPLMEAFYQNISNAKMLMSKVKPEGFFMPPLKNVDIASFCLPSSCQELLPPILLSPTGLNLQVVASHQLQQMHMQRQALHPPGPYRSFSRPPRLP